MKATFSMNQSRKEHIIYVVVWSVLFAAPLLSLYVRTASDPNLSFDWNEIFIVWRRFAVYLLLFLIHNFLLAPLLVHHHRRFVYFSALAVIVAAFAIYQYNRPERGPRKHKPQIEQTDNRPPFDQPHADTQTPHRPSFRHPSPSAPDGFPGEFRPHHDKPPFIREHDILDVLILLLIFAANLGLKGYFRSRDDRKRLAQLEHENLEQQLEYLRYQINPHFFMNTLNNIHSLVDIDPEKAKDTIVELSKMMRYVLYEGNKQGVPLSREFEFIRHYVALMQLRYTDKVKITLDIPDAVPDREIPPLILITFIENAFKHGITYQRQSFVNVSITIEDNRLHFICSNSKAETPNQERGGVGLDNVRKRLDLIYPQQYTLDIDDQPQAYTAQLIIPIPAHP